MLINTHGCHSIHVESKLFVHGPLSTFTCTLRKTSYEFESDERLVEGCCRLSISESHHLRFHAWHSETPESLLIYFRHLERETETGRDPWKDIRRRLRRGKGKKNKQILLSRLFVHKETYLLVCLSLPQCVFLLLLCHSSVSLIAYKCQV